MYARCPTISTRVWSRWITDSKPRVISAPVTTAAGGSGGAIPTPTPTLPRLRLLRPLRPTPSCLSLLSSVSGGGF